VREPKTREMNAHQFAGRANVTVPTVRRWCRMIKDAGRADVLARLGELYGLRKVRRGPGRRWWLRVAARERRTTCAS